MMMLSNSSIKLALVHLAEPGGEAGASLMRASMDASMGGSGWGGEAAADDLGGNAGGALGGGGGGADWWRTASAEALEAAYARLALHRLSQAAATLDASEFSEDELAERQEPFTKQYLDYDSPTLPARPPALVPFGYEEAITAAASTIYCAVGGLLWGCASGARASVRAKRAIWRSAAITMVGASALELLMRFKISGIDRARTLGKGGTAAAGTPSDMSPLSFGVRFVSDSGPAQHGTLRGLALLTSLDVAISSAMVLAVIQPGRAPMAFGGWALGRIMMLLVEVEVAVAN